MENPATWGEAEKIVDRILEQAWRNEAPCGLSLNRQITDALRLAGLLRERPLVHCVTCDFPLIAAETCDACGAVTAVVCLSCHPRSDADKVLAAALRGTLTVTGASDVTEGHC